MKHTSVHAEPINNIAHANSSVTTLVVAKLTAACDTNSDRFVGNVVKATINKKSRFCIVSTMRGGKLVYAGKLQYYTRDKRGKVKNLIFDDEILTF